MTEWVNDLGFIPGPGTPICFEWGQKGKKQIQIQIPKKKKKKTKKKKKKKKNLKIYKCHLSSIFFWEGKAISD